MHRPTLLALGLSLGPFILLGAQAPAAHTLRPTWANSSDSALGLSPLDDSPDVTARDAERLEELEDRFSSAQAALVELHLEAKTPAERSELPDVNLGAWAEVKPRVVEASKEFAGTPSAVPFLLWIVRGSGRTHEHDAALDAMWILLDDHASDARVIGVAGSLRWYTRTLGVEDAAGLADAFEDAVPGAEAKAAFRLASVRIQRPAGKALTAALDAIVERFPETKAARQAASWAFEIERLQVGMTVPDLTGTTLDGETFRLSDHRGKVVVLEFWAVNCGPCLQKMPRSAERVRRLTDEPFLHVGIQSCTGTLEAVEKIVEERGVNWPVLTDRSTDGSPFGPIGTQWNLSGWPTVFLIDHEGVIRSDWATEDVLETMLPGLIERAGEL